MKNFSASEFKCSCCGMQNMDWGFTEKLDYARDIAGIPFIITSGYRCPAHNQDVGGVSSSSHIHGHAADIACTSSEDRYTILVALQEAGFDRIGIADSFIHVDDDPHKIPGMVWHYG